MGALQDLEKQLDVWLNKKAPVQLPPAGRKALAGALWWIALIVGILQLLGTWVLWAAGHTLETLVDVSSGVYTPPVTVHLGLMYWLSLVLAATVTVLLLMATPKLKRMQKEGWDLLYYAMLLSAAFTLLRLFAGVAGVFSGFFGAAIGTVLGAYFLFQVHDYFTGAHAAHDSPSAPHHVPEHGHKSGKKEAE